MQLLSRGINTPDVGDLGVECEPPTDLAEERTGDDAGIAPYGPLVIAKDPESER